MSKFEEHFNLLESSIERVSKPRTYKTGYELLKERDRKLVEALKAVVTADYSQAYEPRKIAKQALIDIGEDI